MTIHNPVYQFCEHVREVTIIATNNVDGDSLTIRLSDDSILTFMQMSTDFSDTDLLSALPLCIAYMLTEPFDDSAAPYAFHTYSGEFWRRLQLTTEDIFRVCGNQAVHLPYMLNAILQMRLIQDDDGTMSLAVGDLKMALFHAMRRATY